MPNTPSSIVCFKNGFSFVCIPVSLNDSDEDKNSSDHQVKSSTLGPLPDKVVHGTIGLQPDNLDELKILSVSKAPSNKKTAPGLDIPEGTEFSIPAYLGANIGKHVVLNISNQDGRQEAVGKIKKVMNAATGSFVVIEINDTGADMLIDTSLITSVQAAVDDEKNSNQQRVLVRYQTDGTGQESKAVLSYLTPGLTWAPSYSLVLDKTTKTLKLEGKACLMCDLNFLEGDIIPEVCLVTGKPNMLYQNITDPLVSDLSASDFVKQLEEGMGHSIYSSQKMAAAARLCSSGGPMYKAEGIDKGETVEDFFHYVLKNVPIQHNHPISMDFIKQVPSIKYEDVYTVDIPLINTYNYNNKEPVDVKHAISFKNTTGQPLTTAPATVLFKAEPNNKFLVQGLMKYCLPGHDANLEMTTAHDVQVTTHVQVSPVATDEQEKDRKYTQISALCEVVLVNYKQESIKCKVGYELRGTLATSDPEVKSKISVANPFADNNQCAKYAWEINIDPQEEKKIVFSYTFKSRTY